MAEFLTTEEWEAAHDAWEKVASTYRVEKMGTQFAVRRRPPWEVGLEAMTNDTITLHDDKTTAMLELREMILKEVLTALHMLTKRAKP